MKKILTLFAALAVTLAASTSFAAPAATSLAKCQATTFCENCFSGGDILKAGCMELDFLQLALNPKSGRYEGGGTVKVFGAAGFVDNLAQFSVAMIRFEDTEFAALGPYPSAPQFILDLKAEGHNPNDGAAYAVTTVSQSLVNFAPSGFLAIKDVLTLEVVSAGVPGLGKIKSFYR